MLDAIAWRPEYYRGIAIVDDSFDDKALQELHDGGVRGVRFNFVRHLGGAPDMGVFNHVIDRIRGRGWHVVLHLDATDIVPLSEMIARLPVPFVIANMGWVDAKLGVAYPAFRYRCALARRDAGWYKV